MQQITNPIATIFLFTDYQVLSKLLPYAPPDDKLLDVPLHRNIADPLFSWISGLNLSNKKNKFLTSSNLLALLQRANRFLSKAYAAHKYILEKGSKTVQSGSIQADIDDKMQINDSIPKAFRI